VGSWYFGLAAVTDGAAEHVRHCDDRSRECCQRDERDEHVDTSLLAYPCAPHGITDTHKEHPGNDLLTLLNSTANVHELVGFSTGKDDA